MSGDKVLNNEGVVETIEKVSYSKGNGISKLVIAGAIVAVGVGAMMFIKRRRAKKAMLNQPVVVDKVNSQKTEK